MSGPDTTREKILASALQLFATRGYHGTSVPLVAENAGVGAGTIYRHFSDKQNLVNVVFRESKQHLRERLKASLETRGGARETFDAFWAELVRFTRDEPMRFRFLELHHHSNYLDEESLAVEMGLLADVYEVCEELMSTAERADQVPTDEFMSFVWGAFVGLFKSGQKGYLTLSDASFARARDACWRAFFDDHSTD